MFTCRIAAICFLCAIARSGAAQDACPPPHDDYRRPVPVWGGFGYQVNACAGDKVDVAGQLIVSPDAPSAVLLIPQTLPWELDLSRLTQDQIAELRDSCQSDLPCTRHFRVSVLNVLHSRNGCPRVPLRDYIPGGGCVIATLDGWH